jgi:hypothetical protein
MRMGGHQVEIEAVAGDKCCVGRSQGHLVEGGCVALGGIGKMVGGCDSAALLAAVNKRVRLVLFPYLAGG